jgi:hypothetical protein
MVVSLERPLKVFCHEFRRSEAVAVGWMKRSASTLISFNEWNRCVCSTLRTIPPFSGEICVASPEYTRNTREAPKFPINE